MNNFTRAPGMIYDLGFVISWWHNTDGYMNVFSKLGIQLTDKKLKILNSISFDDKYLKFTNLLFHTDHTRPTFFLTKHMQKYRCFNSVEAFIESFECYDPEQLVIDVLSYYDEYKKTPSEYTDIISSNMTSYVSLMDVSCRTKWELMNLWASPKTTIQYVTAILNEAYKLMTDIMAENQEDIDNHLNRFYELVNNNELLAKIVAYPQINYMLLSDDYVKNITLCYFHEVIVFNYTENYIMYIFLGVNAVNPLFPSNKTKAVFIQVLKALSVETRFEIYSLLKSEAMTLTQIANKFNMPISTADYHLDIMQKAGLLNQKNNGNRMYYFVNIEYIEELIKFYL